MIKIIKIKMTLDFLILMNLRFIPLDIEFFLNPFYLLGMLSGVNLVFQILVYGYPNCKGHQVMVSFSRYRLA
jgi:hypothetical protein